MNKISQEELPKPFETGLGQSRRDYALDYQLDQMAPYVEDFPYDEERMISKGGEGRIYIVKRICDEQIFVAKMRFNPATRPDLDYDGIIEVYKNFLGEVEMLSHSNHSNISQMLQALRNNKGNLYIIMEYFEEGDLHAMRLRDLGQDDKYYEEEKAIKIFR